MDIYDAGWAQPGGVGDYSPSAKFEIILDNKLIIILLFTVVFTPSAEVVPHTYLHRLYIDNRQKYCSSRKRCTAPKKIYMYMCIYV